MKRFFNIAKIIDRFPEEQKRILKDILTITKNDNKDNIAFFVDRKKK